MPGWGSRIRVITLSTTMKITMAVLLLFCGFAIAGKGDNRRQVKTKALKVLAEMGKMIEKGKTNGVHNKAISKVFKTLGLNNLEELCRQQFTGDVRDDTHRWIQLACRYMSGRSKYNWEFCKITDGAGASNTADQDENTEEGKFLTPDLNLPAK